MSGRAASQAADPAHSVGEELDRDVLVIRRREGGRKAPALGCGEDRFSVRSGGLELGPHRDEEVHRLADGVVAGGPATGRRERDDGLGTAAGRELQRDVAAERVADDVGGRDAGLVHGALDPVGQGVVRDLAVDRRPARVAGERRGEHVVLPLQRRQHELPGPPGIGEAVHADQRRAGSAAM